MKVAVTDTYNQWVSRYVRWLQKGNPDIECYRLSYLENNARLVEECDGLVLTGGGDIHPRFYGREDALPLMEEVDVRRDEFEITVIGQALHQKIPILGICRGMQIFNVAMGGSMIPDVEKAGFQAHRGRNGSDGLHPVHVEVDTEFCRLIGALTGTTTTNHHQAVDRLGRGLRVTVQSEDGVREALEWQEANTRPFLQLVAWHPERMKDAESPFSGGVLRAFLSAVRQGGGRGAEAKKRKANQDTE